MSNQNQNIEMQAHKNSQDIPLRDTSENKSLLQPQKSLDIKDFQGGQDNTKLTCYESLLNCFGNCFGTLRAWLPCICCCMPYPYFQNDFGNKALVEKFGKLHAVYDEGLHKYNPMTDKYRIINLKTQIIDLSRQIILTNDNITVNIDALVYFRITDPLKCQYKLVDHLKSIKEITTAAVRAVCGEYTLQQILEEREKISDELEKFLFDEVQNWGIFIEQAFIKDLVLSDDLQKNLSSVAKSRRLGEAKVISADSDVKSAKLLRDAADMLDSEAAMQIRYFEQLQSLSKEPNPKVMFLPLNDKQFQNGKK